MHFRNYWKPHLISSECARTLTNNFIRLQSSSKVEMKHARGWFWLVSYGIQSDWKTKNIDTLYQTIQRFPHITIWCCVYCLISVHLFRVYIGLFHITTVDRASRNVLKSYQRGLKRFSRFCWTRNVTITGVQFNLRNALFCIT